MKTLQFSSALGNPRFPVIFLLVFSGDHLDQKDPGSMSSTAWSPNPFEHLLSFLPPDLQCYSFFSFPEFMVLFTGVTSL
jgi:hypothetical protein